MRKVFDDVHDEFYNKALVEWGKFLVPFKCAIGG